MKRTMGRKGFTLIELLVVIGIISILGGLILTAVAAARTRGRKTNCTSNMRQIFLSIHTYQLSFPRPGQSEVYPYRINLLNTAKIRFIATPKVMLCPLDPTKGQQGGKPSSASSQYAELDEKNPNLSYMYEFSGAQCTWTWSGYVGIGAQTYASSVTQLPFMHDPRGEASWGEVKTAQYKYGDSHLHTYTQIRGGWPSEYFPILRCFWHQENPDESGDHNIRNLALDGSIWDGPPTWETEVTNYKP